MFTWSKVKRADNVRQHASADGRWEIVNAHPHRSFGAPWKLYRSEKPNPMRFPRLAGQRDPDAGVRDQRADDAAQGPDKLETAGYAIRMPRSYAL